MHSGVSPLHSGREVGSSSILKHGVMTKYSQGGT